MLTGVLLVVVFGAKTPVVDPVLAVVIAEVVDVVAAWKLVGPPMLAADSVPVEPGMR